MRFIRGVAKKCVCLAHACGSECWRDGGGEDDTVSSRLSVARLLILSTRRVWSVTIPGDVVAASCARSVGVAVWSSNTRHSVRPVAVYLQRLHVTPQQCEYNAPPDALLTAHFEWCQRPRRPRPEAPTHWSVAYEKRWGHPRRRRRSDGGADAAAPVAAL